MQRHPGVQCRGIGYPRGPHGREWTRASEAPARMPALTRGALYAFEGGQRARRRWSCPLCASFAFHAHCRGVRGVGLISLRRSARSALEAPTPWADRK
eukprot:3125702-Prymnesium_polylepis.1